MDSEPIKKLVLNHLQRDESLVELGRYMSVHKAMPGEYTQEETDCAHNAVHDICDDIAHKVVKHLLTPMNEYEMLEWIHFAIQEAQNGNTGELDTALGFVEDLREGFLR